MCARVAIIGCGQFGRRLAKRLIADGHPPEAIEAVSKHPDSVAANASLGLDACAVDLDTLEPGTSTFIPFARSVYYFAPPPRAGTQDTRLARFLSALHAPPRRLVLISTTSVYGDCQGAWIDETAPTPAPTERAKRRLDAEQTLKRWAAEHGTEWLVLRTPGIYAPDRLPIQRVRQMKALVQRDQAPWTNRIHADDLVEIAIRAMRGNPSGQVVNVCDDHPGTMSDYFQAVRYWAGLPPLPEQPLELLLPTMSAGMQRYMKESRRLRNARMKSLWGKDCLTYPDLATGLAGCSAQEAVLSK